MDFDVRVKKIDATKTLLQLQMERVLELLDNESEDLKIGYNRNIQIKAELKAKMHEIRRDMIRLEKLMYDYNYEE